MTKLEALQKEAVEFECFDSFFAGLSPDKEKECIYHYEVYLIEHVKSITARAFRAGLEEAKECVVPVIPHERHPDDRTYCGYCGNNEARQHTLAALDQKIAGLGEKDSLVDSCVGCKGKGCEACNNTGTV